MQELKKLNPMRYDLLTKYVLWLKIMHFNSCNHRKIFSEYQKPYFKKYHQYFKDQFQNLPLLKLIQKLEGILDQYKTLLFLNQLDELNIHYSFLDNI